MPLGVSRQHGLGLCQMSGLTGRRPMIIVVLSVLMLCICALATPAQAQPTTQEREPSQSPTANNNNKQGVHRGHLPRTRFQKLHEKQERERAREAAEIEAERAAELRQEAQGRREKWLEERKRLRQAFLDQKQKEEEERRKQEAALKAAEDKKLAQEQAAAEQRLLEQQKQQAEEERKIHPALPKGSIVGGKLDCFGVPGGGAVIDACGVCGGDDLSCADCAGVPNGNATQDCAGICGGTDFTCLDCAGVMNGDAQLDACGVCEGDGTSCLDCLGVLHGTAVEDVCGVCNGDGTTCIDCRGVPNGDAKFDPCGICEGDGTSCCSPLATTGTDPNPDHSPNGGGGGGSSDQKPITVQDKRSSQSDGIAPRLCSGHGTCSYTHHFCVCDQGWTGPFCSVQQNLCLQHQDAFAEANPVDGGVVPEDLCNRRGACDPMTGMCRCFDTTAWFGTRCEFSTCSYRGAYDLERGRCTCQHGYGGQYCERCASARPKAGKRHVCMQIVGAWQRVPKHLWLTKSILLHEKNPKAPVFTLVDAEENEAIAYVNGRSFMNLAPLKRKHGKPIGTRRLGRDFIWPNSTHQTSGYYYDCGCRLAKPPTGESEFAPDYDDTTDTTDDSNKMDLRKKRSRPIAPHPPAQNQPTHHQHHDGNGTDTTPWKHPTYGPYRPEFPLHLRFQKTDDIPNTGGVISKRKRQGTNRRLRLQGEREGFISPRAPATLPECQDLLQDVLDEFGFSIVASTADVTELSAAIADVSSTCGSEASFAYAWFLIVMVLTIVVALFVILCVWGFQRYIKVNVPFEEM